MLDDTIAAVATPPGRGGIGIIRISGRQALSIATVLSRREPAPRQAHFAHFLDADGETLDSGLLIHMPAPASYTGESVVEVQAHGSPQMLSLLLERIIELGARQAEPGEFTRRAWSNGKLDLAQAEAVADLIEASGAAAARAAARSLQGVFSARCDGLVGAMTALRVRTEAGIDFPDEDIDSKDHAHRAELVRIRDELGELLHAAERGRQLTDGLTVVISGPPNAGKSSLMNVLAGQDTAIVTETAGTTRDVLREQLLMDGVPLTLIDTAGLRDSDDPIEREGVRRARAAVSHADRVLWVMPEGEVLPGDADPKRSLCIWSKSDLGSAPAGWTGRPLESALRLSSKTGEGIELLRKLLTGDRSEGGEFSSRRRHLRALQNCAAHLQAAAESEVDEITAEELRLASLALGEVTGAVSSDELLGRIFGEFCIGK